jgi:hypothetical protein
MKMLSQQIMNKKTKRLYDRMQHGIEKKQQKVDTLLQKRKALEEKEEEKDTGKLSAKKNDRKPSKSEVKNSNNKKMKKQ